MQGFWCRGISKMSFNDQQKLCFSIFSPSTSQGNFRKHGNIFYGTSNTSVMKIVWTIPKLTCAKKTLAENFALDNWRIYLTIGTKQFSGLRQFKWIISYLFLWVEKLLGTSIRSR